MKKIIVLILTMASLGVFAQELPDAQLLQILEENTSKICFFDQDNKKSTCDCSNQAHLADSHRCRTGGCCDVTASGTSGENGDASCPAIVGTNSEKFDNSLEAIKKAEASDQ